MTPTDLATALEAIGWKLSDLARRCGASHSLALRWKHGTAPVPDPIARWLQTLVRLHQRHPAPAWRRR